MCVFFIPIAAIQAPPYPYISHLDLFGVKADHAKATDFSVNNAIIGLLTHTDFR